MKALLLSLMLATPATAQQLRLGTEGAYPPYTFLSESGILQGIDIDLGNEICARIGAECTWVINEWATIIDNLLAGDYDAILAAMSETPERAERVLFTQPYEAPPGPSVFVGTRHSTDPETAMIAVQADTIQEAHLRQTGRKVQPYPTAAAALAAVLDGSADLVFGSGAFLEPRVFGTGQPLVIVGREQIEASSSAIALRKEDTALAARFDAAIDDMKSDGSLIAILIKWLPAETDL